MASDGEKPAVVVVAATAATAAAEPKPENTNISVGPDGKRYKTAQEGLARIFVPLSEAEKERQNGGGAPTASDHPQQVFYNPIQQFNRDLSVLAIKAYGRAVLERRTATFAKRKQQFASKKRKRQEKAAEERPSKVGKVTEMGAAETEAEGEKEADTKESNEPERNGKNENDENDKTNENKNTNESHDQNEPEPTHEGPKIRILDALSATGLRALRYAHELPFPVSVTANDLLAAATESIRRNVELNGLTDKISVVQSDALAHMYMLIARELGAASDEINGQRESKNNKNQNNAHSYRTRRSEKYDVIDLDPYGTGAMFFDAAVQAVRNDGGLLCVTCTDAGVWASTGYPEKCFSLYGGVPMKGSHSHEAGLRIVLHALAASAAKYGLTIAPQLSLSIDFYCRVFVTVERSPASVKFQAGKTMVAYNCDQGCGAWTTQPLLRNRPTPNKKGSGVFYKYTVATAPLAEPLCAHCGTKMHLGGPMYAGPIHNRDFVQSILDDLPSVSTDVYGTTDRIRGMLQTAMEELLEPREQKDAKNTKDAKDEIKPSSKEEKLAAVDPAPFFFLPTLLAKSLHCVTPNEDAVRGALLHLGYQVTRSHCRGGSIKTDAPWDILWHVMREWVRQKFPVHEENIKPGTAAYRLLRLGESDTDAKNKDKDKNLPEVVFDEDLGRQQARSGNKIVRYQINPRENWGPMNRAKGH